MNVPSLLNLVIPQAADFDDLILQNRHKVHVRQSVAPTNAPTVVKVDNLSIGLSVGDILLGEDADATIAEDADYGAIKITIASAPTGIKEGTILISHPIPIAGWAFAAKINDRSGGLIANFDFQIADEQAGKFKIVLPREVTMNLTPTCYWEDYQGLNLQHMGQPLEVLKTIYSADALKRMEKVTASAHRWDLEQTDELGSTKRSAEGLVVITGGVTL